MAHQSPGHRIDDGHRRLDAQILFLTSGSSVPIPRFTRQAPSRRSVNYGPSGPPCNYCDPKLKDRDSPDRCSG